MKIGVMFGSPETTTGGNALKFYASVRMDVRRVESLTKGEETIGNHVRVKVVKNKVAPPFKKAEFDIMFSGGFDRPGQIVDVCTDAGILKKSGTWFSYGDNRLGQGKENVKQFLRDNPKMLAELEAKAIAVLGKVPDGDVTPTPEVKEIAAQVTPVLDAPAPKTKSKGVPANSDEIT